MRETLIEFMDSLREYIAESGTNIARDERDSSEFVDIFLNKEQTLLIDSGKKYNYSCYRAFTCHECFRLINANIAGCCCCWDTFIN